MLINETTSFSASVMVKDASNIDTIVMYLSSNLDASTMNININANTVNKTLLLANAIDAKAQYNEFKLRVQTRAIELGYVIF